MKAVVRQAKTADLVALAAVMRPADVAECLAAGFASPHEALLESVGRSDWSALVTLDGEPAACLGVTDVSESLLGPRRGRAWLLSGPAMGRRWRAAAVASRAVLAQVARHFDVLHAWVDARHAVARRWLGWLGFLEVAESPLIPSGPVFLRVERWNHGR